jgi:RNA polymerase sigma factor (sigma-70 family)
LRVTGKRYGQGCSSPLSPTRERDLITASDAGDRAATEELVAAFLPAIDGVAYLYRSFAGLERAELRQEGVAGLLKAAKRYDRSLETPFWAYASWWVRQAMQNLVSELTGPVVLSDRATRHLVHMKQARSAYRQAHRRDPSTGELAAAADLSREQVENLLEVERTPYGLDERLPGEGEMATTLVESLADPATDDAYERVDDQLEGEYLRQLTGGLDDRERGIVFDHYGIDCRRRTLREIARGLHLSVERVRQLEERALVKLREAAAWPGEADEDR